MVCPLPPPAAQDEGGVGAPCAAEAVGAAHDKVEAVGDPHDEVEAVGAAHDEVETVVVAHDEVVAAHDAVEHGVHNNYLCATFHFIFQPNTAVSQKMRIQIQI